MSTIESNVVQILISIIKSTRILDEDILLIISPNNNYDKTVATIAVNDKNSEQTLRWYNAINKSIELYDDLKSLKINISEYRLNYRDQIEYFKISHDYDSILLYYSTNILYGYIYNTDMSVRM